MGMAKPSVPPDGLSWLEVALFAAVIVGRQGSRTTATPAAAAAPSPEAPVAEHGAPTDPPALAFANALNPSQAQATAYAAVYPLTMCLRILTPQLILAILWTVS